MSSRTSTKTNNSTNSNNNNNSHKFATTETQKSSHHKSDNHRSGGKNNSNNNNNNKDPPASKQKQSANEKNANSNNNNNNNNKPIMSNLASYSLIDDDHIDDQETINVGNLIIDLESDLEKEKFENEQQQAKSTIANASSSTTSTSSSTTSTITTPATSTTSGSGGQHGTKATNNHHNSSKTNQKSQKHSNNTNSNQHNLLITGSTADNSRQANTNDVNAYATTTNSASRTVFKTSADERNELRMRITRENRPGKSEHKIVSSPNQKSPTSCSSSNIIGGYSSNNNNNNTLNNNVPSHANNFEDIYMHESSSQSGPTQSSSSISSTKECGTSTSIGTITEPECLGPCEPGTSVNLEGIVWQETEGGILVVNVTWRGKTYVGALLDCTKHDWAPPRLCDSPASDIDSKAHKGVRAKRIVTRSNGIGLDEKNLLQTTGKLRNGKGRRIPSANDPASSCKKLRESDKPLIGSELNDQNEANGSSSAGLSTMTSSETATEVQMSVEDAPSVNSESTASTNKSQEKNGRPQSPVLIGCEEPNCSKKFRNTNGLQYHQAHAHSADGIPTNTNPQAPGQEPPIDSSSPRDDKINATEFGDQAQPIQLPKVERVEQPPSTIQQQHQPPPLLPPPVQPPPLLANTQAPPMPGIRPLPHQHEKMEMPVQESSSSNRFPANEPQQPNINTPPISFIDSRPPYMRGQFELGKNHHYNPNLDQAMMMDFGPRPPMIHQRPQLNQPMSDQKAPQNHNRHSTPKSSSSGSPNAGPKPAPVPTTTEEGMKPSGTSTGPPPAPHQANFYFNSASMANSFNIPYGFPSFFPRQMFDPLAPPVPVSNAAFLNRYMSNLRGPGPADSPSRLLSPSTMPSNMPPFPLGPGGLPIPPPPPGHPMANITRPPGMPLPVPPGLPSLPPNPGLPGGGPSFLRMPSQGDRMLPPE